MGFWVLALGLVDCLSCLVPFSTRKAGPSRQHLGGRKGWTLLLFCFYLFCHLFLVAMDVFWETHFKTKVLSVWRQYCQLVFSDLRLLLVFFLYLKGCGFSGTQDAIVTGHTQPIGPECDCQLLGILDGLRS